MTLVRLAKTPWIRSRAELHALNGVAAAPHRVLRAAAGPWVAPTLSDRLPASRGLMALVRALNGRLVVANPCAAAVLPLAVRELARAVLRHALDAAGAPTPAPDPADDTPRHLSRDARLSADRRRLVALFARLPADCVAALDRASWGAAALYEPSMLDVHLSDAGTAPAAPAPLPIAAPLRYRLALIVGRGNPPESWDALDAAAIAATPVPWPAGPLGGRLPWFHTRLLVPDALVTRRMDQATLARWAARTGRGGPATRDDYWFADSWDRFREPGRLVGHVTPADIARSRRAHGSSGSAATALTPAVERGVCVPPGYCLVDCVGTLDVAVVPA
jgi:hypothetical protein